MLFRSTGNDKHSLFANPQFVNPAEKNFHLQRNSPAIDKGANLGAAIVGTEDLDGAPRCRNEKIDIGCYEM